MYSDLADYYLRWYHERPVGITSARRDELRRLHAILYRCIDFFVHHYEEYVPRWMPMYFDKEMEILQIQKDYPFRAGTYRPDYLVTEDGRLKLCEITSRFFAHGIFSNWFSERAADRFMDRFPGRVRETRYEELLDYMAGLIGNRRKVYVFKSDDRTHEIRLYRRFYEAMGCRVEVLEAGEIDARRKEWSDGAFLISALNQRDIYQKCSMDSIKAMVEAGMYNDFRTIYLLHDKRFMRLWFQDCFTSRCLSAEETVFLRSHAIPTWVPMEDSAPLGDYIREKDRYILKPARAGKSVGVYAGPLTDERTWLCLWEHEVDSMVIQPFLRQRTYPAVWEGQPFDDYLCGMMLCVDDRYFDSGMFRCSSYPVTNVKDDRKACPLHTDDPDLLPYCDIL